MNELQSLVNNYVLHPRDANVNFQLGLAYSKLHQYAASNHYLLRAAEFYADGTEEQFTSLIEIAYNFLKLGNRDIDADIMADYAGAIDMDDPRYQIVKCITACKRGKWINLLNRSQMAHQIIEPVADAIDEFILDETIFSMYEGIANLHLGRFDKGREILLNVINSAKNEKVIDMSAKGIYQCGMKVANEGTDKYDSRLGEDAIVCKELHKHLGKTLLELNLNSVMDINNFHSFDEDINGIIVTQDEKLLDTIQLNRKWQTFSDKVDLRYIIKSKFPEGIHNIIIWNQLTSDQINWIDESLRSGIKIDSILVRHFDELYDPCIDPLKNILGKYGFNDIVRYGLTQNLVYLTLYHHTDQVKSEFIYLNDIGK